MKNCIGCGAPTNLSILVNEVDIPSCNKCLNRVRKTTRTVEAAIDDMAWDWDNQLKISVGKRAEEAAQRQFQVDLEEARKRRAMWDSLGILIAIMAIVGLFLLALSFMVKR